MIEVDVYNDSTPMTEEQRSKLFQKFSRLDNAETRKVKGTGLGLYITRQIIEGHGGSIKVEPREHGNSFVFQIERS
jgi:signal transduction histidine kinase